MLEKMLYIYIYIQFKIIKLKDLKKYLIKNNRNNIKLMFFI